MTKDQTAPNLTAPNLTTARQATSLRRKVAIGAAAAVATGALLGAGVTAASAAPVHTAYPTSTSASSDGAHVSNSVTQLVKQVRSALFQVSANGGQINGGKAQAIAKKLVSDHRLFSQLPEALQTDIRSLADASHADRAADALKIRKTALGGGYGQEYAQAAKALQATADLPISSKLEAEIAADVKSGSGLGDIAAKIATSVSGDKALFSALPQALQSDVTELAHAPASEQVADLQKIQSNALDGQYGGQLKSLVDQLTDGISIPLQ
jgi:hypothetical protein